MLNKTEIQRYTRQIILDGFGVKKQRKLKSKTALVAGVGGLGGTAAVYLAVAGIGRLILVHSGNLTISNMNRQILMRHNWIGRSRVIQAMRTIKEINPDVDVVIHDCRLTESNTIELLEGADIALSARPNFQERRALNAACIMKGIPVIEAAMNALQGYLFNIFPGRTPCLNCVFPDNDPEWEELGFAVLGSVSGVLGCLMSIEALKILTEYGKPLESEMLLFDAKDMFFKKVKIHKDSNCTVCGRKQAT